MGSILRSGKNCSSLESCERAGLFIDGRAYYRAFYEAAQSAESQIFMMGWQFDSGVQLVRGADVPRQGPPAALLPFLASLLARKKNLQIRILAWDHSLVFAARTRIATGRHLQRVE